MVCAVNRKRPVISVLCASEDFCLSISFFFSLSSFAMYGGLIFILFFFSLPHTKVIKVVSQLGAYKVFPFES